MRVLGDTSALSLYLRRLPENLSAEETLIRETVGSLALSGQLVIVGPVRQELLSGIRHPEQFEALRDRLRAFADLAITTEDYEIAARYANICRSSGVASSSVDILLCAIAANRNLALLTTDPDFERYAKLVRFRLHHPRG